jgi:hypothetical protein
VAISWNDDRSSQFLKGVGVRREAIMVKEWIEAAGFVIVIAACYMMVVPI